MKKNEKRTSKFSDPVFAVTDIKKREYLEKRINKLRGIKIVK